MMIVERQYQSDATIAMRSSSSDHFATPFAFAAALVGVFAAGVFAGVLDGTPLGTLFLADS